METADSLRVGVLSLHNSKETKALLHSVEALGHRPEWLREENVTLALDGSGEVSLDPDVDVVINRLLLSKTRRPSRALGVAESYASAVPVVNAPDAVLRAIHKFAAASHLESAGVPTPNSVFAFGAQRLENHRDTVRSSGEIDRPGDEQPEDADQMHIADGGSTAVVHKTSIGTHGTGVSKLYADETVPQTLGVDQGILQELLEQPDDRHSDVRVYVVDGTVVSAMRRLAPDDDWRTNVSRGGSVEDATDSLPEEARTAAVEAASAVGLDCAGIDLVEGTDGWYVLEANPTAGFKGLFEATGVSPAPHIARLAIERAGGTVDEERVETAATSLDDSVPECRPSLASKPSPDEDTLGYTERVQVCGRETGEEAVAKADTGATRTSIDTALAGRIGAGPIVDVTNVKTGSSKRGATRPLVEVVVRIGEYTHAIVANIEDRSHMSHDVLLGRDILEQYSVRTKNSDDGEQSEKAASGE